MTHITDREQPYGWPAPQNVPPAVKRGRGWKISFLIWNALGALFLVLAVVAGGSATADCSTDPEVTYVDACEAGAGIGASIAVGGVLFLTVAGDAILGVGYAIFKKREPQVVYVQYGNPS